MSKFLIFLSTTVLTISCTTLPPQKYRAKIPPEPVQENSFENPTVNDAAIINVKTDGTIFYKNEKIGTIDETGKLGKELTRVFEDKKKSNHKNATAVFVKAGRKVKYGDITKLVEKLKAFGAAPIGLQIDDLEEN